MLDKALFYIFGGVAVLSAALMVTRRNAVHSAVFLITSLLATAGIYLTLRAEFLFIVQIILYVGGIMVLFVFVVMMLNLGPASVQQERVWLKPGIWGGPVVLAALLLAELLYVLFSHSAGTGINNQIFQFF